MKGSGITAIFTDRTKVSVLMILVHFQLKGCMITGLVKGITSTFTDRKKVSVLMIHCSFPSEGKWDNWYSERNNSYVH